MDRMKTFTDLMHDGKLQAKGVCHDEEFLENMLYVMRLECYSDELNSQFQSEFVDSIQLTNDLKLTGVLGECLI